MGNLLKTYMSKRQEVLNISSILDTGAFIIQTAEKIGKRKILKPSEHEIDKFKYKCLKLREALVDIISYFNNSNNISIELINQIKSLKMNTINDCKKLGQFYFIVGKIIKNKKKCNIFFTPITYTFPINVLEGIFISIILFLGLLIIGRM